MIRRRVAIWLAAWAMVMAVGAVPAEGKLILMPQLVPTGEVLGMVEQWVKEHPADAAGYYTLGRVEALAWAYGEKLPLNWGEKTKLPGFGEYATIRILREGMSQEEMQRKGMIAGLMQQPEDRGPAKAEDWKHLEASIAAYTKAVALDPQKPLYQEGLAWMLQQKGKAGVAMAGEVKDLTAEERGTFEAAIGKLGAESFAEREAGTKVLIEGMPRCMGMLKEVKSEDPEVVSRIGEVFRTYWDLKAMEHYRLAYALTVETDLKNAKEGQWVMGGDRLISADSADELVEILARHPERAKRGEVQDLRGVLEKIGGSRAMVIFDW